MHEYHYLISIVKLVKCWHSCVMFEKMFWWFGLDFINVNATCRLGANFFKAELLLMITDIK